METKKAPVPYSLIAGILFATCALQELIWCIRWFDFYSLLYLIAFCTLSTLLLLGKRNVGLVIASLLLALTELVLFIDLFDSYQYYTWGSYSYDDEFNILVMLLVLLISLAYLCMLCLVATNVTSFLNRHTKTINNLWFLPTVLISAHLFLTLLSQFLQNNDILPYYTYHYMYLDEGIHFVLIAVALFFYAAWIIQPVCSTEKKPINELNGMEEDNTNTSTTTATVSTPEHEAYCDLVKHILLLIFTFGIWLYIWIYKTTGYTNAIEGEEQRTPTNQLLLCLFVPFYIIYWTYKTAQRIDKMATAKGLSSDLTTLCLILEIFIPIIPPILLQEKMNHIVAPANAAPIPKAPPQKQPTSVPTQSTQAAQTTSPLGTAEEIRAFKELLDIGAITEEEFNAKKKQLLGL